MKKFLSALFAAMFAATLSFPTIADNNDAQASGTQLTLNCPPWC